MAKLVFLCLAMLLVQVQLRNVLLPVKEVNTFLSTMLSQYSTTDYDVMVHFDDTTFLETYTFIENVQDLFQAILVLNYDKKNFYNRPLGYKFVHVVFLSNSFQFGQFSEIPFNLEFNDVVLILNKTTINHKSVGLQFWQQEGLERAGSVFVLNIQTNDLYHECFYCGHMSGVLQKISVASIGKYFNYFSNFYGQHFKVGYMPYLPFFWTEGSSENYSLWGPEGKLLEMLSSTLNFEYFMENFEEHLDGEWTAMIDAIHHRQLDWAVGGISSSTERAGLVDMTKTIHTEMFRVLFHCCTSSNNWHQSWQQVAMPFQIWLWFWIFIMLAIMTLLLKIFSNDHFATKSSMGILRFFEMSIRGVIDQPLTRIPVKCMTGRFLLISWWFFAIIIATAYRSKLASSLIHPYHKQPNTIRELLQDGYTFQVNSEDWSVLKENFEKSADPMFIEILERSDNHLNICSSIQYAVKNKVAVIDEETNLQYEVIINCDDFLTPGEFSHLRLVAQEVFPSDHVWPLQLGAPYRKKFSMIFETLFASGIVGHLYNVASNKQLPTSKHYNDIEAEASPLSISTMFAPALILSVGLLLATFSFMCEIAYVSMNYLILFYKRNSKNIKKY